MTAFIDVTDETFDAEVLQSDKPVLVDLWAPWCGPCRSLAPELEKLAAARGDTIKYVKVNVDDCKAVADRFPVRGIPALLLFRDGSVAGMSMGAKPQSRISKWLDETLATEKSVQSEQAFVAGVEAEEKASAEKKAVVFGRIMDAEKGLEAAGALMLVFNAVAAPVSAVLGGALLALHGLNAGKRLMTSEEQKKERQAELVRKAKETLESGETPLPSAWEVARSTAGGALLPVAAGAAMLGSGQTGLAGAFTAVAGTLTIVRGLVVGAMLYGTLAWARNKAREHMRDAGQGPA